MTTLPHPRGQCGQKAGSGHTEGGRPGAWQDPPGCLVEEGEGETLDACGPLPTAGGHAKSPSFQRTGQPALGTYPSARMDRTQRSCQNVSGSTHPGVPAGPLKREGVAMQDISPMPGIGAYRWASSHSGKGDAHGFPVVHSKREPSHELVFQQTYLPLLCQVSL